jgi:hypothetical protein
VGLYFPAHGHFKRQCAGSLQQQQVRLDSRRATLQELTRAAGSVRVLTDYLERHPESLLRGKPEDKKR